jgi:predicted phage tail component-like protein
MSAYTVKIENAQGDMLQLYPSEDYILTGMAGITPADAVINTVEVAAMDGARFNNSRVGPRNITVTLKIRGKDSEVRRRRVQLYKYIRTKQKVRLYIANDQRDAYIDGYVESLQDAETIFAADQRLMLSVICPDPYFRDNGTGEQVVGFSSVDANFYFPLSIVCSEPVPLSVKSINSSKNIYNAGDTSTGMVLTVTAYGAVENPVFYDETTGGSMAFSLTLAAGDELIISTIHGSKRAALNRAGTSINVINTLDPESTWLELAPGDNVFYYTASSGAGNMELQFSFTDLFEGI